MLPIGHIYECLWLSLLLVFSFLFFSFLISYFFNASPCREGSIDPFSRIQVYLHAITEPGLLQIPGLHGPSEIKRTCASTRQQRRRKLSDAVSCKVTVDSWPIARAGAGSSREHRHPIPHCKHTGGREHRQVKAQDMLTISSRSRRIAKAADWDGWRDGWMDGGGRE